MGLLASVRRVLWTKPARWEIANNWRDYRLIRKIFIGRSKMFIARSLLHLFLAEVVQVDLSILYGE